MEDAVLNALDTLETEIRKNSHTVVALIQCLEDLKKDLKIWRSENGIHTKR
jgi:hypothetical protein